MTSATQEVRAGCYLRISSDPQDKRAGVTRQREDTAALCEIKGWQVAGHYVDNDRSASNGKQRPEWDRLLADIKAGKIDAIAAWDQDRGWRMMRELEELRAFFAAIGRPILLATTGQGDIDLSSPTGVMLAQVKTAVSEHEIAMMRVRQLRAARQRAEQGRPKWRRAFGYLPYMGEKRDDDGRREPDPVTAPLVAEAYRGILAGASLNDIARRFNDAGHHGLTGRPWTASTVSLFLRSPRNAGLRDYQGEIVGEGTWTPLVDPETWRAAQAVMTAPSRQPGRKTVRKHLLTGMLLCGKCGGRMGGVHTAGRQLAYVCKNPDCRGVSVRRDHVEPMIFELIVGALAAPDAVDLLKSRQHDTAEAEALRTERATLLARLDEIAAERADGLIDGRGYAVMTERVNAKLDAIERRQHDAERVRIFDDLPLGTAEVAAKVETLSPDRLRAVIDVLMTITVDPVGKSGKAFRPERLKVAWR
ncbi:serine recombinase [Mycolicibacter heraklionensis]|uniref:Serine recombinase n=1 Tax=Mycolicibacter heraklionensis TaxID=512402 RepID=A0AA91ERV4_9MYCO|nr:serine recombinase [Mycolicibacter heraklionensis]